jgi:hypothetical protein
LFVEKQQRYLGGLAGSTGKIAQSQARAKRYDMDDEEEGKK